MYVLAIQTLLDQATADVGVGGPFHTCKIALYTNDVYPNKGNVLADFVITDFGGLTNLQAVTFGTPFQNDNTQAEVLGGLITWLTTALTLLPITAYGYVYTDTAGAVYLGGERFANPIVFTRSGQSESLVPRLVYDC